MNPNPSWKIQPQVISRATIAKPRLMNMIDTKTKKQKGNNKQEERELRNKLELIGVEAAN